MIKPFTILFMLLIIGIVIPLSAEMSITWKTPQNTHNLPPCESIFLSVDVSADAGVKHVQFYANDRTKFRDRAAPYEYEWNEVPSGFYKVIAKLVDNNGDELDSEPLYITVGENQQANLIGNGDFSCGLKNWSLYTATDVDADVYIENFESFSDTAFAYIEVIESFDNIWFVTLYQDFPISAGHTYQVYFSAEVGEDKMIGLAFQHKNNPWPVRWVNQKVPISPDSTEYGPYEFVCAEDDAQAQFKFLVGGNDIDIAIDNVRVIDTQYIAAAVEDLSYSVKDFKLSQNYPNPFNPQTTIRFSLAKTDAVTLEVFDLLGQKIATLINGEIKSSGQHNITFDAADLPSGIYLYKLRAGHQTQINKMMLVR